MSQLYTTDFSKFYEPVNFYKLPEISIYKYCLYSNHYYIKNDFAASEIDQKWLLEQLKIPQN